MTAEEIEYAVLDFLRQHMDLDRDIKKGALCDLADIEADREEYNQVVDQLTSQGFLKKYNQETIRLIFSVERD